MLISGSSRTPNVSPQGGDEQIMYSMTEDLDHHHADGGVSSQPNSSSSSSSSAAAAAASLFCSLSVLKEKVHQIHSLVSILLSPHQTDHNPESTTSIAIASMSNVIQELIVTASSMMFTCQQMSLIGSFSGTETLGWFGGNYSTSSSTAPPNINTCNMKENSISVINRVEVERKAPIPIHHHHRVEGDSKQLLGLKKNYDIIELDAADLLAKYTHYCRVCGKGFKRDANLRMHMRAHGDEYKTSAALSNPMKKYSSAGGGSDALVMDNFGVKLPRKLYSCPQEGCRWNQRHAKFQPLKSMICVKNHYKRCHCPKMYVCKRCNRKNFSVLSDLRTHEKHCGDLKWQCSCGTTFSRKDKLMAHVVLFTGHSPMLNSLAKSPAKVDNHSLPAITDSCNYIVAR